MRLFCNKKNVTFSGSYELETTSDKSNSCSRIVQVSASSISLQICAHHATLQIMKKVHQKTNFCQYLQEGARSSSREGFFLKQTLGGWFLPQRECCSPWSLILTGVFELFLLRYYYRFKYFMLEICFSLGNKNSLLPTLGVESQGGLWSSCTFHACSLVRCSHRLSIFFKPIFLPMLMLIVKISRILMSMLVINLILMQILTINNC